MGLAARGVKVALESLSQLKLPAILHWDMNHFVVLTKVAGDTITVHDPARGRRVLTLDEASDHYTGVAMELTPAPGFEERDEREKISAWQLVRTATGLKGAITQVLLLSLVLEVLAIASPFFLQLVVDRVVVGRDRDLLAVLGIGFALLAVMIAVITALRAWLGVYISTRLNLQLLDTLFARLLRLPLAWFEKRHIGDIVSRFRQRRRDPAHADADLPRNGDGRRDGARHARGDVLVQRDADRDRGRCGVLYGALRWAMYGPQRRATDERIVHEAKAATHFIETLRGMMAIKLNLRETERRSAYLNHVVDQTNADVRVQNLALLQRAGNVLIFGLENVTRDLARRLRGARQQVVGRHAVRVPAVQAAVHHARQQPGRQDDRVPHARPARRPRGRHRAGASPRAPAEMPSVARADAPTAPFALEARDLGFAYGIEGFVFRGLDFVAQPGEMVAIVGPSGAGKTTLVKVLAGLLDRTEGVADRRRPRRPRLGQGRLPQPHRRGDAGRPPVRRHDRGQHQLLRPAARLRSASGTAPALAMIDEEIVAMPMGYNTIVGSLGMALSGGQRSRVLLARALYREPQILFLDETFDQLDLARERAITDGLRKTGIGLVIVSHRPETVGAVDRIVRLGEV